MSGKKTKGKDESSSSEEEGEGEGAGEQQGEQSLNTFGEADSDGKRSSPSIVAS